MGVAAYNRGSKAIREQISREQFERNHRVISIGPAFVPEKPIDPLPEGRLRSSFLPEFDANGTAIFLEYRNRWYVIESRFETYKRVRNLDKAIRLFERLELYGLCALEAA
jgi:hypothetical protein